MAYTLYFTFVKVPQLPWMLAGQVVLGLYTSFQIFAGFGGLLLVVPAAMAFARAAANGILLYYAFQLYMNLGSGSGQVRWSNHRADML
jgi:hypothetical protein